jgi:Domain of unknown function (DUF927)
MQDLSTTFDTQPSEHDSDGETPGAGGGPIVSNPETSRPRYEVKGGMLYRVESNKEACLANFSLEIVAQHIRIDESVPIRRDFLVNLHINGRTVPFTIPSDDFCSSRLVNYIAEQVGSEAIVYAGHKDLRIATQELSPTPVPVKTISTSMGFNGEGAYLAPGMLISNKGTNLSPGIDVDLSEGNFSKLLGFLPPDLDHTRDLARHLHGEFLQLKGHEATYPLMGHIVLAAFASIIGRIGWQKPVMHLQGPSGSGKTFLGNLAAAFYGSFDDRLLPWTSTANAIETEGFFFRDALFPIDDFKMAIVDSEKVIRIIQNSANSQGRTRLRSGGSYKLTPMRGVRGLILSTGEDFIPDVESVAGRTILIHVEPNHNLDAGASCWRRRGEYRMMIPGLLQWLLAEPGWEEHLRGSVLQMTEALRERVTGLSNGTRVASNWALNAYGFEVFVRFSVQLGVLTDEQGAEMLAEYGKIMMEHISAHAARLQVQDPSEVFFRVLSQKFATGAARVIGLTDQTGGKLIGKLRDGGNIVCLFPDPTLEVINSHFRSLGRRLPFSKETLREALSRADLLIRSGPGRVTHQVRVDGSRLQAWQFDTEQFKARCGIVEA